ncbi:MAG: hypothetical protein JSU92_03510, partial [Deltaproteobacteria bacterium]
QDGVSCPRKSPWPKKVSMFSLLPLIPIIALAVFVLAQTNTIRLIIWLSALGIFAVPLRYLVCARCPYYGQYCSTLMGKTVPLMFKKQEGKSMKPGLWIDMAFFVFLFFFPVPDLWRFGGIVLVIVWFGLLSLFFIVMSLFVCSFCPLTFCPANRGGKRTPENVQ